jgi:heat shock protein beta
LRVQVAKRNLGSVPAIVTSSDFGNSANMERIMRAQAFQHGVDPSQMRSMKIFEINPRHPLIVKLLEGCPPEEEKKSKDDDPNKVKDEFKVSVEVIDAAWMLHDMAMLNGGFDISDTKGHNHRLTKMLKKTFELESLSLEPEINPPVDEDEPPELDTAGMFSGLNMEDFGGMGDFDMNSLNMMDLDDLKADA